MSKNDLFAAAAHLHVVLRRKTGRVTDTEWMVTNAEYASAIVEFSREQAANEGHTDLLPLAQRLETLVDQIPPSAHRPLIDTETVVQRSALTPAKRSEKDVNSSEREDIRTRYIGRLR